MANGPIVEATLGLDTTAFQRGLARANAAAAGFKQSVERLGLTSVLGPLTQGAGLGIVVGALVMGLRSSVQEAMRLREEAERTGEAIDDSVASAARLGDTFAAVSTGLRGIGIRVAAEIQEYLEGSFGANAPIWRSIATLGGPSVGLALRAAFGAAEESAAASREQALTREADKLQREIDQQAGRNREATLSDEERLLEIRREIGNLMEDAAMIDQSTAEGRRDALRVELRRVQLVERETALRAKVAADARRADEQREAAARRLRDIEADIASLRSQRAAAGARAQAFARGGIDPATRSPLRSAAQIAAEGSGGFRSSEPQRGAQAFLDASAENQLRFQRELRSVGAAPGPNATTYEREEYARRVERVRARNEQAERNFLARQDKIDERAARRVPEIGEQKRRDATAAAQQGDAIQTQIDRLTEIRDAITGANTAT